HPLLQPGRLRPRGRETGSRRLALITSMAQTKTQIQAALQAAGISPLKRFGQNFLIDANLMRKLVSAAELRPIDVVLEVGPGTGSLTELLLEQAGHVVAVEIDRGLRAICEARFGASDRF